MNESHVGKYTLQIARKAVDEHSMKVPRGHFHMNLRCVHHFCYLDVVNH